MSKVGKVLDFFSTVLVGAFATVFIVMAIVSIALLIKLLVSNPMVIVVFFVAFVIFTAVGFLVRKLYK